MVPIQIETYPPPWCSQGVIQVLLCYPLVLPSVALFFAILTSQSDSHPPTVTSLPPSHQPSTLAPPPPPQLACDPPLNRPLLRNPRQSIRPPARPAPRSRLRRAPRRLLHRRRSLARPARDRRARRRRAGPRLKNLPVVPPRDGAGPVPATAARGGRATTGGECVTACGNYRGTVRAGHRTRTDAALVCTRMPSA